MSWIELIELCVVGVLMLIHVISNFVGAKCSCKVCTLIRSLLNVVTPSDEVGSSGDVTLSEGVERCDVEKLSELQYQLNILREKYHVS